MKKYLAYLSILLLLTFLLPSCAVRTSVSDGWDKLEGLSPSKFNKLQIDMTKQEVISILGEPESTSVSHGAELLHYRCVEQNSFGNDRYISYGVLLRKNKVLAFGRHTGFANDSVRWQMPRNSNR